ncbi:PilZ domain-containing protein [Desulfococcaceae bacterium HSG8]|nr:PilZ domain-containing protein [Desulfococcaceae bacterium HSG8]
MPEKRKQKRRHLIYYLNVFDRNTDQRIGQLVNITTDGVMLTSEDPIEADTVFEFKMILPEEIKGIRLVTFDARSRWYRRSVKPRFYDIGFELLDISSEHARIIENLISDFSFQN